MRRRTRRDVGAILLSPLGFRLERLPYPRATVVLVPLLMAAVAMWGGVSVLSKGVHGREPHAAARGGVAGD
jgi:hypothetical protein